MKKFLLVTLALIVSTVFAAAVDSVPSKNVVGYVNIDSPPAKLVLAANNFRAVGGGDLTLTEVFGTDQLRQAGFAVGVDIISIWDAVTQTYANYWQKTGGTFHDIADVLGTTPVDPAMPVGTPFWLTPANTAATTTTLTLLGEASGADTSTQSLVTGLNQLNMSYAADFNLGDNDWIADGATGTAFLGAGDVISVWNVAAQGYANYWLKDAGTWHLLSDVLGSTPQDVDVLVGQTAWYTAAAAFDVTIDRPYTYPVD